MCLFFTHQVLDRFSTLTWTGEKTRREARGGGRGAGWDSAAAGSAQRAAGCGAAARMTLKEVIRYSF